MAYIIETPNAFQPLVGLKKYEHEGGISILEWLQQTRPGFQEFEQPTICLVNGHPVLREDWKKPFSKNDIINFVTVVGDPLTIIALVISVVLVAVTVALSLFMKFPDTPGGIPESDPVYSIKGKQNLIRLGEPIEVNYGRNRIYPSMASRPYYLYESNEQYQHSLFCIGQGEYEIEDVQIGDTDIGNFQEASYEIIPPGGDITIFQTNIYTSAEAGGQTLYASNEPEYTGGGYVGPFVVSPPGTQTDHIDIDILLPRGLFVLSDSGSLLSESLTVVAEYRAIDDSGNALTAYSNLFIQSPTAATTTPQRITIGTDVPANRYEVRLRRTTEKNTDTNSGNDVQWDGMRGYLTGDNPDYGDVTLLAVKIQATGNLNANTRSLVNVICTRKLPLRDPSTGSWSEPIATRSIIWAFVDIFRSAYGGRLDDRFFAWEELEELEDLYEYRNEHFDFTFRDLITVWEAARAIAQVGRAVPVLVGSQVTLRREGQLVVPVTLFGPDNIVKGSFEWNISLWDLDEYDSILAEYTEPSTGYTQEEILVTLPGDTSDHPESVRFTGVQERNHVYHQALFLLAKRRYVRETFTFETGMEGFIPSYGDLIAVSHDVPDWGQSGYIVEASLQSDGTYLIYVSQELVFESGQHYQMLLRNNLGEAIGPYDVVEIGSDNQLLILDPQGDTIDFLLGGRTEPMLFAFGPVESVTQNARIIMLEPQGGERIKITCTVEVPIIHTFDHLDAPALPVAPFFPDLPDVLEIPNELTVTLEKSGTGFMAHLAWTPVPGTNYYEVSYRPSDKAFANIQTTTTIGYDIFIQNQGTYIFSVTPVSGSGNRGTTLTKTVTVSLVGTIYVQPISGWVLDDFLYWKPDSNVPAYQITFYDNRESGPVQVAQHIMEAPYTNTFLSYIYYNYTYQLAQSDDNLYRDRLVEIDSMYYDAVLDDFVADGLPSQLEQTNAIPNPPTPISATVIDQASDGSLTFQFTWSNPGDDDIISVRLWISDTSGFDPSADSTTLAVVLTSSAPQRDTALPTTCTIDIPLVGETFSNHYYRIGLFDLWGEEIDTNVSSEQTITIPWLMLGAWDDLGRWDDTANWQDT